MKKMNQLAFICSLLTTLGGQGAFAETKKEIRKSASVAAEDGLFTICYSRKTLNEALTDLNKSTILTEVNPVGAHGTNGARAAVMISERTGNQVFFADKEYHACWSFRGILTSPR